MGPITTPAIQALDLEGAGTGVCVDVEVEVGEEVGAVVGGVVVAAAEGVAKES